MKTIFTKFAMIILIALVIGYGLIMAGVNVMVERTFIDQKTEMLVERAKSFEELYNEAITTGLLQGDRLLNEIVVLEKYIGSNVWIIGRDGRVFVNANNEEISIEESGLTVTDLQRVFDGEIIERETYFMSEEKNKILTVGYPVRVDDQIPFGLFLNTSIPEIKAASAEFSRIILVSLGLSVLITITLVAVITGRMSRSLKDLTEAARTIATGHFDKKIRTSRKDELGELAESFNHMAEELNYLESTKRRFISNLSHDLRSPLTTITGYTGAMLDGTIDEANYMRYIGTVHDEALRLRKMVNDLLDLSKFENGEMVLEKTDFDINQMLLKELDRFEKPIVDKRLKLSVELCETNVLAHGDASAIERVIYNLIDNAIKFSPEGGKLTVRSELKEKKFLVGVRNSGNVLSEEERKSIWERFAKLDTSRGRERQSSGLGLSIVKEIVKAHGEKIEVYSDEEIGVMFVFSLTAQFFPKPSRQNR